MRILGYKLAASLLLTSLAAPQLARAEGAAGSSSQSSEAYKAAGKARYERGVEAYSAGRYKDAIDLFLQADALAPSAALSFNIARAYEKIGDDAATLQWYRDFRRRAPDAKNGAEVDARIRTLEGVLAKKGVQLLTVFSSPPGATVIVDDKPVGVTPFTGQLIPGEHQLVLTLKGYNDAERKVTLGAARAQDVEVALEEAPATPTPETVAPAPAVAPREIKPEPAHRDGPRFGPWPWVTLGVGGATLGAALGFELARRSAEDAAAEEPTQIGYQQHLDKVQSRQTTARVLVGVGGALVVTGGVLLAIDLGSRKSASTERASVGGACLPGSCAISVSGRF